MTTRSHTQEETPTIHDLEIFDSTAWLYGTKFYAPLNVHDDSRNGQIHLSRGAGQSFVISRGELQELIENIQ